LPTEYLYSIKTKDVKIVDIENIVINNILNTFLSLKNKMIAKEIIRANIKVTRNAMVFSSNERVIIAKKEKRNNNL
tara:strand:- start:520 stop:747 length:228 start_codon:yes stop_codon:yes gene_type:complete